MISKILKALETHNITYPLGPKRRRRFPEEDDFPNWISVKTLDPLWKPDEAVEHCIILLHDSASSESSLEQLALRLRRRHHDNAFLLLRGLWETYCGRPGYAWNNPQMPFDGTFLETFKTLLIDVVTNRLVAKCGFELHDVVVIGCGQGGMAALWREGEFGGIISIDGPMPECRPLCSTTKAKTPALVLKGRSGSINAKQLLQVSENFECTISDSKPGDYHVLPGPSEMETMFRF